MHTMVLGPTGAGKNKKVIDALRYSAVKDPRHTAISFSLKTSDYGPMKALCTACQKKIVVLNLNDAWRSIGWNPLANVDLDAALDMIRRFTTSVKNSNANDSAFWDQWIRTALAGAWQAGHKSFPEMYNLFSLPLKELIETLQSHGNASSRQLAQFLNGGSQNADSVCASIVGALSCFIGDNVTRVMSNDQLTLRRLFRKPVYLHCEISETKLETLQALYQMVARAIEDALIDVAETSPDSMIPATIFCDDLPSLGCMQSPARLMTMRSRSIGTVSGIQSLSSLEMVYGPATRALIDNVNTKVILPGGVSSDAEFFSQATGMQMVALPCNESQTPVLINRPLICGADIRTPGYTHPIFGMPSTVISGSTTFQAYLQSSYEIPEMAANMRRCKGISGREKLRRKKLSLPGEVTTPSVTVTNSTLPSGITDTTSWSQQRLKTKMLELLELVINKKDPNSIIWWHSFCDKHRESKQMLVRVLEELMLRKSTLTDLLYSVVYCNSESIEVALAFLDYMNLRNKHQQQAVQNEAGTTKASANEPSLLLTDLVASTGIEVILDDLGPNAGEVAKVVKSLTGMSRKRANSLLRRSLPVTLGYALTTPDANDAADQLQDVGCEVRLRSAEDAPF
jgi:ribosomal protein L7/L12